MADRRSKPSGTLSFDFALPQALPTMGGSPKEESPPLSEVPASRPSPVPLSQRDAAPASMVPVTRPSAAQGSPAWAAAPTARPATGAGEAPRVLSVAQLGRTLARSLERTFVEDLWVEGEVSGARPASSGHVYFCMKDEKEEATIDVVLYRSQVSPRVRALVKDGARVRVRGRPTYWSPRGKLQFVGDRVEPTGKGALLEALEKLKEKLQAEGLFAQERKRALHPDPRVVGVVTSSSGAVIHDVCKVAFRRGGARILLAPASVQGAGASESIRRALRMLQQVDAVDVIIVGRGGGSQEDLQAFNDEAVVREVAACRVPVVSAVGHEVDVTLVDFAADARAATPSQAAEMVVPDGAARRRWLEERSARLRRAMQARIAEDRVELGRLARAFGDPRLLIASAQQLVDEHVARLGRVASKRLSREREAASHLGARLGAAHPRERIARDRARASEMESRLIAAGRTVVRERAERTATLAGRFEALAPRMVQEREDRVAALAGRLDAMSPLKVLGRGYAIVTRPDGRAVRAAREVARGEAVVVRVAEGAFAAEVTGVPEPGERGERAKEPR